MADNHPAGDIAEDAGSIRSPGPWRKSSFSMSAGDCIEVAFLATGRVGVRDSKAAAGPHLRFGLAVWTAFLGDIRSMNNAR